ncbi:reelin isoform X1 [Pristis pectinata]|uniref:reelin isoform X1 n=2 Tax=Pristis pectinata TaxID=685728 RepID=UPI00223DE6F4|nr:reelin isoform X1 [Pristis pectinata]XP_051890269.1 reelin isoform X1 [Pristis pectinata]XP_051890270.1 reelin isoform X1 [Pristis pectinata]
MDKKRCFNTWTLFFLVGIFLPDLVCGSVGFYPRFAPFFFLCTHHGELEGDGDQGEVLMSLHIAGNPGYYVPGQEYHVTISTSTYFDGLLVTGLYTSTSISAPQRVNGPSSIGLGFMSDQPFGSQFMCSVVASHISHLPQTNLSFVWIAPPAGTGCVNFMATATQRGQIIFKDALVQQLCEQGAPTESPLRPKLAEIHSANVILRDDFDSHPQLELNEELWFECSHCIVGDQCGIIMHGNAITFCEPYGPRELTTVMLNTTTASVLQFSIGSGTCRYSYTDPSIAVFYSKNSSTDWIVLERIRAPSNTNTIIHIIYLPQDAKGENIKFKWAQEYLHASHVYEACWALDNILIINAAHKQMLLEDNLDPIDTGNWLFFPGATVKHSCQSDGNSMYFHGTEGTDFNFVTTRDIDLRTEGIVTQWVEEFESQPAGWETSGAVIGTECGEVESGSSLVFLEDGSRVACTPFLDTTNGGNLRFYFSMGAGSCSPAESHENDVMLYAMVEGRKDHILDLLPFSSYRKAALVSVAITPELQTPATRFCLRQKSHHGLNRNVWAVDFFHILPVMPPAPTHLAEFSINMGCGSHQPGNSISLEFSTNHGRSWSLLHMECLPDLCAGPHHPHSSVYSSENYSGWSRITIPLPYAALTTGTRFRWSQMGPVAGNMWAIDNVYIGPACYKLCSGRGRCTTNGCKCDPGFSGPGCDMASQTYPTIISESFSSSRLSSYHNFHSIRGAELGFGCGVLSSGKALVFNKEGRRELITSFLDSTSARFLQFTLRLGSKYVLSTCKPPDRPGEGILLHFSADNGITWNLLQHYSHLNYHEPRIISVELPQKAQQLGIQFRWWQPYHSGPDEDVWAIDEISMTSILYNSISLNFSNLVDVTQSLGFYLGNVQPYCNHDWTLSFTGDSKTSSSMRYVETQSMQIGASYMLQFNLVMGCGKPFTLHVDNQISLEYSTNHGLTWHLVQEECFPSMPSCQEFTSASVYHSSEFPQWKRVTVPLQQKTWSSATRFRWSQSYYMVQDEWALDDIYIGQQCPGMCNGHGWCHNGLCSCDPGYRGSSCKPEVMLPSTVTCDFENEAVMKNDWQEVIGGQIVKPEEGCGIISSGSSLYFSENGKRQLVSWDLDTQWVDFIQFYIRIGGNTGSCNTPDSREEGVLLQYSNNGGITWNLLSEMYFSDFSQPRFVYFELPASAKTTCTRFRWWQAVHSGEGYDQWAIDDIIILSERQKQIIPIITPTIQQDYTPSYDVPLSQLSIWLMLANEGMGSNETFCSMTHSAMVFAKSDGDRVAVTRDLTLKPGYLLQFKLNIGCECQFSSAAPVLLQYSHDAGRSWSLVKEGCYPASPGVKSCEGSSRELRESTIYYIGDFETWTRITVIIPRSVASSKTRFRWFQETSIHKSAPAFGLDEVYISEPCPNYCSGHGDCISGVCFCDLGYSVEEGTCVPNTSNPSEMTDRFEDKLSPLWLKVTGGQTGIGCGILNDGKSLYFNGPGGREARTVCLDTTNIRLVQFYIRIGSKTLGSSCSKPRARNEGIVVQYTNDNGVTWHVLRELDYMSFLQPQIITVELLPEAKTISTAFRWWQPQHGKLSAQWALDDVLIGMNDSSLADFQDTFDDSSDLQFNWYRIQGGNPDMYCLSKDTALVFNLNIGKPRFAETWDFHVTASTFLQFELNIGCGSQLPDSSGIQLQYSLNTGKDWHLAIEECVPPTIGCLHYTESSVYTAQRFQSWKRVTVYLSPATISPRTRFRWIQTEYSFGTDNWAIDNVILASGCPWMCSGHGICDMGHCVCDSGFGGRNCVPILPLPSILKDDFNEKPHPDLWPEVLGAERGNLNGEIIKSGTALEFNAEGLRMLVSRDLECTNTLYIQFSFKFIAKGAPDRSHSVLLQYSINGGITWHLMDEFYFPQTTEVLFINVPLPHAAQTNATRFRLWQPHNEGQKEEIWIIDDLIIDGNNVKNSGVLLETFDFGPKEDDWFFYPGGNIGLYCPYVSKGTMEEDSAIVFVSNMVGEHSITTRDLDVNENTIVQFEINVGCNIDSSASDPIRLEFSRDFGATWHLLLPLCYSSGHISSLCSTELHPSSTYYAGTTHGWKREVIHFGRLHLCGSVRFRWYQGFYRLGSQPVTWAIDNVYIGPQCEEMCNGHGSCVSGTRCICDARYSGPTCKISSKNPDFLKGDFKGPIDPEKFLVVSGGKPSRKCGLMSSGNSLFFSEEGLRMLMTVDMDLSQARFVQFFLRLGCGKASPDPRSQPMLLQYSMNGGLSWGVLQEFLFSNSSNVGRYIALEIPLKARSSSTRLRWWQPSEDGHFYSPWAIDEIIIGGSIMGNTVIEDNFSTLDNRKWLLHPGGTKMPVCGSTGDALVFIEKAYTRYVISTDVVVNEDSFLQFDFAASCSVTDSCYAVELQYSVDLGLTWQPVLTDCLPSNVECNKYHLQKILVSDTFNKWTRLTLPLPPYTRSQATRFRWYQPAPFEKQQTWAIDNVYIGDSCLDMCTGHGRCSRGSCICDEEWNGMYCDEPKTSLPRQLKDNFNRSPSSNNWLTVNGGKLTTVCGVVASGMALHFSGGCTRQLVTVDLDLSDAEFIQFYFMYGCLVPPSNRNQGVFLDYSINGGITWNILMEIFFDQYNKPSFVSILLPSEAKVVGARFRWWQPTHDGHEQSDWAIDNVLIAGSASERTFMLDTFSSTPVPPHDRSPADSGPVGRISFDLFQERPTAYKLNKYWMFHDECSVERFCDSPDGVMLCGSHDGREVDATTHDLTPSEDWIVQFKISVGCKTTEKVVQNQVHVQYSTDFGVNWRYLMPQCLPADPQCSGDITQPSVFFPAKEWKRAIYTLPDNLVGNPVRFRFYQKYSDIQWAIDNFYVGPACPNNCGGHGDCLNKQCFCDPGFSGSNCYLSHPLKTSLKERFEVDDMKSDTWISLDGGKACTDCGVLVEDLPLYFSGVGMRQAITQDLDLRGTKFVQYWARIGSENNMTTCHQPICRKEGVLLDYSTDGGITWNLLHEMDYQKYISVRQDYVLLPEDAHTNTTRLRWWQPFVVLNGLMVASSDRAQWALDNILIGGSEINPSQLMDSFDDEGVNHDGNWIFYPNAVRTAGFCGNPSFHLYWPNKKKDKTHNFLASRELIVAPGYVLQFRIVIGCEADSCGNFQPVLLEYSKDPRKDSWSLVQTECLPSTSSNIGCSPFQFHEASIYTAVNCSSWNRVTIQLPEYVASSATQFRWIQKEGITEKQSWGIDNVYIGESCPRLCSGHGYCRTGTVCICDEGYQGDDCSVPINDLPSYIKTTLNHPVYRNKLAGDFREAPIGSGCGQLAPYAHGESLYFNGCQMRQAVTKLLDLTRASKIMFVLQIGSLSHTASCNIDLTNPDIADKAILLQYSLNGGITWHVIAQHQPKDFIHAQRISYNVPLEARVKGVLLRWWQPRHNGAGHDQWALDHVEVVLTRKQNYMMNFSRQHMLRHYYSRRRRSLRRNI